MKASSLDKVVHGFLVSKNKSTLYGYQRYLQFAIWAFREMNLHAYTVLKIKYLTVRSNNSVFIPKDFVRYTRVAIVRNGRIVTLGLNKDMGLPRATDVCGNLTAIDSTISNESNFYLNYGYRYLPHYHNGQFTAGVFGAGGGYNEEGYFKFDYEKGLIWLDSDIAQTEIMLEYMSDGVDPDGTAAIPIQAEEAIRAYIDWQVSEHGSDGEAKSERKRLLWIKAFNRYRHLNVMFTQAEYLDMLRNLTDATPKR